jgi:hypothetical protein
MCLLQISPLTGKFIWDLSRLQRGAEGAPEDPLGIIEPMSPRGSLNLAFRWDHTHRLYESVRIIEPVSLCGAYSLGMCWDHKTYYMNRGNQRTLESVGIIELSSPWQS